MARQLSVRLLGELSVMRDGRVVPLPASKKTRSLLGYLVATARPHLRERLCSLLWDGPDDPRAQLRWSLAKLRPVVDDEKTPRLVADREHAGFDARGATIDFSLLRAEVRAESLASTSEERLIALTELFRGEFLDGLDLPGCYRFHEWCVGERESLRSLRVALLSALVNRLRDRPEKALVHARTLVAIDPLSEAAHVSVIELLGTLGRTREARDQVETCKRILERELSSRPSMALERARMALGRHVEPVCSPFVADVSKRPAASEARLPLVGRRAEGARIDAAVRGDARAVLLFTGDPGMGKTRLLEELAAKMSDRGALTLRGRGFEPEMVRPYGAFIDAFRAIPRQRIPESLRADLSPLFPDLPAIDDGNRDRTRLFEAVTRLLGELGSTSNESKEGAGPGLSLVLDDVHWLDEASAALLHFAAREGGSQNVLFSCGARRAELLDNASVSRLLRSLAREGRLEQVELQPLSRAEVIELSKAIGAADSAERIFSEGEGNPLFSLEIARAVSRGEARSGSLDQLIDERLSRLEGRASELVSWAAAFGRSFDAGLLASVTGIGARDLVNGIEDLEHRGFIRAGCDSTGAHYDFAHDLIRQGAYRRLSEPRRKLVHLHIARALSSELRDDSTASDLAHHAALGGDHRLATHAYVRAARRCLRVFAFVEARALAQRGLVHAARLDDRARVELSVALFEVRTHARCVGEDERTLEEELGRATTEARNMGLSVLAQQAVHLLSYIRYRREDFSRARDDVSILAAAWTTADAEVAVPALSNAGSCLALLGREMGRAEELLEEAARRSRETGARLPQTQHNMGVGAIHHHEGRHREAIRYLAGVAETTVASGDHFRSCTCLTHLAMIALERGEYAECREQAARLATIAEKLGEGSEMPFAAVIDALAREASGDETAGADVETTIASLRASDSKALLAYALNRAAAHDVERGALNRALARAEEARAVADAVKRVSDVAAADAMRGRVALSRGDVQGAEECLRGLLEPLAEPRLLSARARAAVKVLAEALGIDVTAIEQETGKGDDRWPP